MKALSVMTFGQESLASGDSGPAPAAIAQKADLQEIKNGSMQQFEDAIVGLFDMAKEEVIISTDFYPPFYNRQKVTDSIQNASKRVKSFRVLLDSYVDLVALRSSITGCPWLFENKKIEIAQSETPIPHWMMMDRNNFRFEKAHPPNEPGNSNLIIRNAKADDKLTPLVSEALSAMDSMWKNADPVER